MSRYCGSSKEVAREAVVNYRERATTTLLVQDRLARREINFNIQKDELFTDQGRSSGEEVAHEVIVNYYE